MLNWENKLSIGVEQFDNHHKELVRLINELYDAKKNGEKTGYLKSLLFELLSYTKYHFTAEERVMDKHDYEEIELHKKEHDNLTLQVEKFINDYTLGKKNLDDQLFEFLKKWLIEHILDTDKKFGQYLNAKGIK